MVKSEENTSKKLPSFFIGLAFSPIVIVVMMGVWYINEMAAFVFTFFVLLCGVPYFLWRSRLGQIIATAILAGTFISLILFFESR